MSISLSRRNTLMAQQILNLYNIHSILDQPAADCMPQTMKSQVFNFRPLVRFLSDAGVSERKYWTKPLRDTYGISMKRLLR